MRIDIPHYSHRSLDYDAISEEYDDLREGHSEIIDHIIKSIEVPLGSMVLDVGCGTGSHTTMFSLMTGSRLVGVDLSYGMLTKASKKDETIELVQAVAEQIPFAGQLFNAVLLIEVVHLLEDLRPVINETYRVLTPSGTICIVTQSHQQIEERTTSYFFPETVMIEKARYPTIDEIKMALKTIGFGMIHSDIISLDALIDWEFYQAVSRRAFSMLHLIDDDCLEKGLLALSESLKTHDSFRSQLDYTVIFARKV